MLLEADDDKTKPPDSSPNNAENPLLGIETTNENCEKIEHEKKDDDPKQADPQKASEASANKLEMFQEKQKFIEEQNRKRKEMLSKVNLEQNARILQISFPGRQLWTGKSRLTRRVENCR